MNKIIEADLFRYNGMKGTSGFFKALRIPGFRYTYTFRMVSRAKRYSLKWFLFSFLKKRYQFKYGIQISESAKIGEGFYIGHFGTIVISGGASIGKNCNIAHNVTIGKANRGKLKGYPTIGDNVWIGTGAVIVGNVKIGSNVLIAPNSFVNTDIPDYSLVIGNPCKIIPKDSPCEGYLNFTVN